MMDTLLSKLGVTEATLSPAEKAFLAENGYLNLGKLLSDQEVLSIQQRLKELMDEEGENSGSELMDSPYIRHPKEEGADRLADLVNKGAAFDVFYTHPKVLAAMAEVLGEEVKLFLASLNCESNREDQMNKFIMLFF